MKHPLCVGKNLNVCIYVCTKPLLYRCFEKSHVCRGFVKYPIYVGKRLRSVYVCMYVYAKLLLYRGIAKPLTVWTLKITILIGALHSPFFVGFGKPLSL